MNSLVCSVRDVKAEAFAPPFTVSARGMAVRMFSDWCSDTKTVIGRHPEDFHLYHVGFFNEVSGQLEVLPTMVLLGMGAEVASASIEDRKRQGGLFPVVAATNGGAC